MLTSVRDPQRALDVLRPAELEGDGDVASPGYLPWVAKRRSQIQSPNLAERVQATSWYHTIDLPGGITTPGLYDHRELVAHYGLPESMAGMAVLDVATFDGFWAFVFERLGARVTALDIASSLEIDIPPVAHQIAEREGLGLEVGLGFGVAAQALGSKVERREGSVYTLNPEEWGSYDLVHVGDLLLHLERPLEALRRMRLVTSGDLHLSEVYDPDLPNQAVRYHGGWSDAIWWVPGLDTLCQWIIDAGYSDVRVLATYELKTRQGGPGLSRAVVRATGG